MELLITAVDIGYLHWQPVDVMVIIPCCLEKFKILYCNNNRIVPLSNALEERFVSRAVARTLIGGGGGGCIFIYSCSAGRVSFQIKFKLINLKRNLSGKTGIYEYTPPQLTF